MKIIDVRVSAYEGTFTGEERTKATIHIDPGIVIMRGESTNEPWPSFVKDGEAIEKTLADALPGGTYDQVLCAMLNRKASHFVVPYTK